MFVFSLEKDLLNYAQWSGKFWKKKQNLFVKILFEIGSSLEKSQAKFPKLTSPLNLEGVKLLSTHQEADKHASNKLEMLTTIFNS